MPEKKTTKKARLGHDPFADVFGENETETAVSEAEPETESTTAESTDTQGPLLELPERFTIVCVEELHGQMKELLCSPDEKLQIDSSAVEAVDTAAVQLLYAFHRQARDAGKTLEWKSENDKLARACQGLNLPLRENSA